MFFNSQYRVHYLEPFEEEKNHYKGFDSPLNRGGLVVHQNSNFNYGLNISIYFKWCKH